MSKIYTIAKAYDTFKKGTGYDQAPKIVQHHMRTGFYGGVIQTLKMLGEKDFVDNGKENIAIFMSELEDLTDEVWDADKMMHEDMDEVLKHAPPHLRKILEQAIKLKKEEKV